MTEEERNRPAELNLAWEGSGTPGQQPISDLVLCDEFQDYLVDPDGALRTVDVNWEEWQLEHVYGAPSNRLSIPPSAWSLTEEDITKMAAASRSTVVMDMLRPYLEAYFPFTASYMANELQWALRGVFAESPRTGLTWVRSHRALLSLADALMSRMLGCGEYSPEFERRAQLQASAIECWRRGIAKYGAGWLRITPPLQNADARAEMQTAWFGLVSKGDAHPPATSSTIRRW